MKDAKFVLEFSTHVLANGTGPNGERDHFQRDSHKKLIFQQSWFYSAFSRAIEMTGIRGLKAGDINMDLAVNAETEIYKRRYGDNRFRTHEAIMPGTQVTFVAVVADHITQSALQNILERMGSFVGLSPYGYRLGYGKFNVVSVEIAPSDSETHNDTETSEPDDQQKG